MYAGHGFGHGSKPDLTIQLIDRLSIPPGSDAHRCHR